MDQSHSGRPQTGRLPIFSIVKYESTITEITEYIYFSPFKPFREFEHKSELNTVHVDLIFEPIFFLWNIIFTFYYTRVRPHCDYSIVVDIQLSLSTVDK